MAQAFPQVFRRAWGRSWRTALAVVVLGVIASGCSDADIDSTSRAGEPTTTLNEPSDAVDANAVEVNTVEDDVAATGDTAAEEAAEPEDEFITLSYWEGALPDGWNRIQQPDDECDNSDPELLVCEFSETADLMATHIGYVSEVQSGTATTYLAETCEPGVGVDRRTVREATGVISTKWGDELHFHYLTDSCTVSPETFYWRVTGGTGRFEDASGLMSAVRPAMQAGFLQVSSGALRVKAELWDDILPAAG